MNDKATTADPTATPPAPVVVAIGSSADGFQNVGAILSALLANFPSTMPAFR